MIEETRNFKKLSSLSKIQSKLAADLGPGLRSSGSLPAPKPLNSVTPTIYKIDNEDPQYSTGNSTQYSIMAYMGK